MDYTIRYGLEFNPFLKNSKEIFVSTRIQRSFIPAGLSCKNKGLWTAYRQPRPRKSNRNQEMGTNLK